MSQKMDSQLQYVFSDWGKSPPPLAWEAIKSKRLEREKAEKENRKRFLLVFFTGNVAMALVLLPFFIFNNFNQVEEPIAKSESSQHAIPELFDHSNSVSAPLSESNSNLKNTSNSRFFFKSNKLTNISSEGQLSNTEYTEESNDERMSGLSVVEKFGFNITHPEFTTNLPCKLKKPVALKSRIMFGLSAGYIHETVGKVEVKNQRAIHKDAPKAYTNWMSGPSNGFNVQANLRTMIGAQWQLSAGLNFTHLAQVQDVNYTYNQVPVSQNGLIVGYFTLPDSLSTKYKFTNHSRSSNLSLSVQIGHPIWKGRRFSLAGSVMAFPTLISSTKGQLPDIDRNSLRNLRQAAKSKGIPMGFGLSFVRQIHRNLFFQINYQLIYTQNSVQMSGARIVSKGVSNALSIGILVPVTFANNNQPSTKILN